MGKEIKQFLKNPETGVILPRTDLLVKNRSHYVPCDKHGRPNGDGLIIQEAVIVYELLLNPITGEFMEWDETLAKTPGLIGCNSEDEGEALMAFLSGEKTTTVADINRGEGAGLSEPGAGSDDNDGNKAPEGSVLLEGNDDTQYMGIDLTADDAKDKLRAYAKDTHEEIIHHNTSIANIVEQLKVLDQNAA